MGEGALTQPLITRPGYGEGHPGLPRGDKSARPLDPIGVAQLPGGGPSDKGLPVEDSLPGYSTYNKPEGDIRNDESGDEPIERVDGPGNLTKNRDRVDVNEDNAKSGPPSYTDVGPQDSSPKTPYPNRDDKPNTHNAAEFVAGLYLLRQSPVLYMHGESRVAADLPEIERNLNFRTQRRSKRCRASLKRADVPNLRWIFAVDCGNGSKVVRVKANRTGNVTKFTKLNLQLACSCPAWRWQGPEFHARQHDYQDPKTPLQGNASPPDIRDPDRVNKVCKHVAAVLSATRDWVIPSQGQMKRK